MPKSEADLVAQQYTAWCYPAPVPDLAAHTRRGVYDATDPSLFRRRLWPRNTEPDDLDILVAGCGTYQAAFYAFKNRHCRVLGIDVSETSLQHQMYLRERHGLSNLRLRHMNLLDVARLGESFDFVVATGVLHHLSDPHLGLAALKSVLRPRGVLSLMVYGRYQRLGVSMLRDVFRLASLDQDDAGVRTVKATLLSLPSWHHVRSYLGTAPDLVHDSGVVDTFLHPVEHTYAVEDVLALVSKAGLAFQGWMEPGYYAVQDALPGTHPLRLRARELPAPKRWALVELISQRIGCHRFLACHADRPESDYLPDFDGEAFLDYRPSLLYPAQLRSDHTLVRYWQRTALSSVEEQWMRRVDGRTRIADIADATKSAPSDLAFFFADLCERGYVVVEMP